MWFKVFSVPLMAFSELDLLAPLHSYVLFSSQGSLRTLYEACSSPELKLEFLVCLNAKLHVFSSESLCEKPLDHHVCADLGFIISHTSSQDRDYLLGHIFQFLLKHGISDQLIRGVCAEHDLFLSPALRRLLDEAQKSKSLVLPKSRMEQPYAETVFSRTPPSFSFLSEGRAPIALALSGGVMKFSILREHAKDREQTSIQDAIRTGFFTTLSTLFDRPELEALFRTSADILATSFLKDTPLKPTGTGGSHFVLVVPFRFGAKERILPFLSLVSGIGLPETTYLLTPPSSSSASVADSPVLPRTDVSSSASQNSSLEELRTLLNGDRTKGVRSRLEEINIEIRDQTYLLQGMFKLLLDKSLGLSVSPLNQLVIGSVQLTPQHKLDLLSIKAKFLFIEDKSPPYMRAFASFRQSLLDQRLDLKRLFEMAEQFSVPSRPVVVPTHLSPTQLDRIAQSVKTADAPDLKPEDVSWQKILLAVFLVLLILTGGTLATLYLCSSSGSTGVGLPNSDVVPSNPVIFYEPLIASSRDSAGLHDLVSIPLTSVVVKDFPSLKTDIFELRNQGPFLPMQEEVLDFLNATHTLYETLRLYYGSLTREINRVSKESRTMKYREGIQDRLVSTHKFHLENEDNLRMMLEYLSAHFLASMQFYLKLPGVMNDENFLAVSRVSLRKHSQYVSTFFNLFSQFDNDSLPTIRLAEVVQIVKDHVGL